MEKLKLGLLQEQEAIPQSGLISYDQPINSYEISRRFSSATKQSPVNLFTPWGLNPQGRFSAIQEEALEFIQSVSQTLDKNQIPNQVIFMPADLYATEVNQWQLDFYPYLNILLENAIQKNFTYIPWSKIVSDNQTAYQNGKAYFNPELIAKIFPARALFKAVEAARTANQNSTEGEIRQAALRYIQERIVEAEIIEKIYQPVKISLVSPEKDILDNQLPRLYLANPSIRFPWLK